MNRLKGENHRSFSLKTDGVAPFVSRGVRQQTLAVPLTRKPPVCGEIFSSYAAALLFFGSVEREKLPAVLSLVD